MASSKLTPGQSQQTAQTENPQNLPATQGGTAPVPYRGDSTNHDDGARDRKTDKLGIVNGVGPLFKKFPKNVGEIVFGERLPLGTEVEVIPVRLRKYYVEIRRNGVDLKYGDGTTPKIFKTAAEANAAGYAVDWDSNHVNKAQEAGEILLLVAGPADDLQDAFYIELDGKNWAPALFNVRRGGYREVYRLYKTIEDRAIARGSRLHGTVFKLWAFFKEGDQNSWYEPRSEAVRKLSPDAFAKVEEARQRLEGKADETPTAAGE
jgi:hypothetical protein